LLDISIRAWVAAFFVKPNMLSQLRKCAAPNFDELFKPTEAAIATAEPLVARGNRPLQMNFEQQLRALVYFHVEEHTSEWHLIQALDEDKFARNHIAPPDGIQKSSFFEDIDNRGLEQPGHVFQQLQNQASNILPAQHSFRGFCLRWMSTPKRFLAVARKHKRYESSLCRLL
jgi:hypothetical protein